jgi:hypothetical protein
MRAVDTDSCTMLELCGHDVLGDLKQRSVDEHR